MIISFCCNRLMGLILVSLAIALTTIAQSPPLGPKTSVKIAIQDDNATSELPFVRMGMRPGIRDAQFSAMYFGQRAKATCRS